MIPGALDILAARRRIRGKVDVTPLRHSPWLSTVGASVVLKLECVQLTGSFKVRGALNALMQLACAGTAVPGGSASHAAVTASAGNHGRAVALAAERLGLRATVFTPHDAPRAKLDAIRRHGADLRAHYATYDEAEGEAKAFARESGIPFVSPYNDPAVIAGAGTIAFEIFEARPRTATLVVPIGGAGLISGMAIAARSIAPRTRVVGVEVAASCAFKQSVQNGRITLIEPGPTLADGLGGNMDPDTITFEIVQRYVDDIVTVTEPELAEGLRGLVREEHLIAEGAGAAAPAAVLAGKIGSTGDVVAIVTGSNIDEERLREVINSPRSP